MLMNRVVPVLLIEDGLLVKTTAFKDPRYVGDPINAVKIFNDKEVDEIVVLDRGPARGKGTIPYELIEEIATEAFMPVAYGGGVGTVAEAQRLVSTGIEKVILNSAVVRRPSLLGEIAAVLGSQAVVASVDYRRRRGRTLALGAGGKAATKQTPMEMARIMVDAGAGEILLHSIDRDGTMGGYDLATIESVAAAVTVPVIACGGAGSIDDLRAGIRAGASAVAASSMFVFHGKRRAVLITYPARAGLADLIIDTP